MQAGTVVLGRYVVDGPLGEGGMGRVFIGHHSELGFPVAIKVMGDPGAVELRERFTREAVMMARVRHAAVVSVLDCGFVENDSPCIVMEFLEGEALEALLARRVTLPWSEAVQVILGVLGGLDAIHATGIVHRDLKPSNIFLVNGRLDAPKLIDFGIASTWGSNQEFDRITRVGGVMGTPEYMSPEQLMGGRGSPQSDVYAAALVLYEMLTGAIPFVSPGLPRLQLRLTTPAPEPEVPLRMPRPPRALIDALMGALALDPAERPERAGLFADALDHARQSAASDPVAELRRISSRSTPLTPFGVVGAQVRALVAAKLPPSRLARPEERRALMEMSREFGRGYIVGAQFWFALQAKPDAPTRAQKEADTLLVSLAERYGSTVRAAWRMVDNTFAFSGAMLSGATALHPALKELFDELSKPAPV